MEKQINKAASELVKLRWAKTTPAERSKHGKMMNKARLNKRKK